MPLRCRGMDKIAQLDMPRCGSTQNRTYRTYRAYKPDGQRKRLACDATADIADRVAYTSINLPSIAPSGAEDDIGDIVIGKVFHRQSVVVHPDKMLRVQRNDRRNSQTPRNQERYLTAGRRQTCRNNRPTTTLPVVSEARQKAQTPVT